MGNLFLCAIRDTFELLVECVFSLFKGCEVNYVITLRFGFPFPLPYVCAKPRRVTTEDSDSSAMNLFWRYLKAPFSFDLWVRKVCRRNIYRLTNIYYKLSVTVFLVPFALESEQKIERRRGEAVRPTVRALSVWEPTELITNCRRLQRKTYKKESFPRRSAGPGQQLGGPERLLSRGRLR